MRSAMDWDHIMISGVAFHYKWFTRYAPEFWAKVAARVAAETGYRMTAAAKRATAPQAITA